MMNKVKVLLVLGAFAVMATGTAQAQIQPSAGCSNAKIKCANNYLKGILGIEAKAAKAGVPEDTIKTNGVIAKYNGAGTGCIPKADAKYLAACPFGGDGGLLAEMDALLFNGAGSLKTKLYVSPSSGINACYAAQTKCVANLLKGVTGVDSKALKGGLFSDAVGLDKTVCKYDDSPSNAVASPTTCLGLSKGCLEKLEAVGKACDGVGASDAVRDAVLGQVTAFINRATCEQSPAGAQFSITTVAGAGSCGTTDGTLNPTLNCGDLYIGGGNAGVPNGATPAGSNTRFNLGGGKNRVCPRTAAETGSSRTCSDVGCFFGSPLPIANGPLSTCVNNTFLTKGYGALVPATGAFLGDILLGSTVTVTGNATRPCPKCSAPTAGTCSADAANPGAACNQDAVSGESHDCTANGPVLPTFAVSLKNTTTGTSSATAATGIFCPSQNNAGAFGDGAVTNISTTGVAAGNLTSGGPNPATIVSVFCIPATGNVLIDGSADLPGPGATTLPILGDVL